MENQSEKICPACKSTVAISSHFCPGCGKQLIGRSPSTAPIMQAFVYFVSLFLPPFGLWYAWKYFKEGDYESRKIAIVALVLTIISVLVTLWAAGGFIDSIYKSLNEINSLNA